jgi:hypothetical protein
VRDSRERPQGLRDRSVGDACSSRSGSRCGSILAIVGPGDARLGRKLVVGMELDSSAGARNRSEAPWDDGSVLACLKLEHTQLGGRVGLEGAMAVEVVGLEIEQHADMRAKRLDILELEGRELADDPGLWRDRPHKGCQRSADVACHLDLPVVRAKDLSQELARRRLAVGARDAEDGVREQACPQLDLAPHGDVARPRARDEQRLTRHPGALHDEIDPL